MATLRQNRGRLLRRPPKKDPLIVAGGRSDWLGWVELQKEPLSEISIKNRGRVLKELATDVQGVVEAESRIALEGLSGTVLPNVGGPPFEHVMLIDGNDERGIDVGMATSSSLPSSSGRSREAPSFAKASGEVRTARSGPTIRRSNDRSTRLQTTRQSTRISTSEFVRPAPEQRAVPSQFPHSATPRQSRLSQSLRGGSASHCLGLFVGEDEGCISSCEQVFPRLHRGLRVIGEPYEPGRRGCRLDPRSELPLPALRARGVQAVRL